MEFYNLSIKARIPNKTTKDKVLDSILWQLEDIGCRDLKIEITDGEETIRV